MAKQIVFLSTLVLAILLVRTEPPVLASEAPSASTASVTQAQAQQALEVLQDEKKRAALIETLQTIAKAAPSAPPSASPAPPSAGADRPRCPNSGAAVGRNHKARQRVCRYRPGGDRRAPVVRTDHDRDSHSSGRGGVGRRQRRDRPALGATRSGRATRLRTLLPLLRTALLVAIAIVIGLTALSELGVDIAPLLAGVGIVGVAIGFGSQALVHDVITGMFLLLENENQVGDIVTAAGFPVPSRTCRSARSGCAQRTARSTSFRSAW
jgi:Mechanosensitive ion channel